MRDLDPSWVLEQIRQVFLAPYESWSTFVSSLTFVFTLVTSFDSKTGWLYLLASLVAAGVLFVIDKRSGLIDSSRSFWNYTFPRQVYFHPSSIVDVKFVAMDYIVKPFTYLPVMSAGTYLSYKYGFTLGSSICPDWLRFYSAEHPLRTALIVVLIADFAAFYGHYLTHKIPLLWYFHQVHHSAEVLTPLTVHRWHAVDQVFLAVAVSAMTGFGAVLYSATINDSVELVTVFGLNVFMFVFYMVAFQLRHSHIWLSYGPIVSRVFLSPAQHQIHHSLDSKHIDKNFGLVLSIWDALFGCLYVPRARESLVLGIANVDQRDFSTPSKLFLLPCIKAVRHLWGKKVDNRPIVVPGTDKTEDAVRVGDDAGKRLRGVSDAVSSANGVNSSRKSEAKLP